MASERLLHLLFYTRPFSSTPWYEIWYRREGVAIYYTASYFAYPFSFTSYVLLNLYGFNILHQNSISALTTAQVLHILHMTRRLTVTKGWKTKSVVAFDVGALKFTYLILSLRTLGLVRCLLRTWQIFPLPKASHHNLDKSDASCLYPPWCNPSHYHFPRISPSQNQIVLLVGYFLLYTLWKDCVRSFWMARNNKNRRSYRFNSDANVPYPSIVKTFW